MLFLLQQPKIGGEGKSVCTVEGKGKSVSTVGGKGKSVCTEVIS